MSDICIPSKSTGSATSVKVIIKIFVYVCSGYYLEWLLSG